MLILTRKLGESVTIGDDIKVTVLGIRGRQVKLGIIAPQKVMVHREEIYFRIQEENRVAVQVKREQVDKIAEMIQKQKLKEIQEGVDQNKNRKRKKPKNISK